MNWLNYANQSATRNQPLSPRLVNALSFLPEMGVTMEVFSGGQDAEGPNRVGSHRHDHGGAGDVFFYKDGRRLDWSNPNDVPIYQDIVKRARANGVTGFGAGDGYMQPGSMHIGFGSEAVWGAGGKGANAPEWLRAAYSGAPAGASSPSERGDGSDYLAQLDSATRPGRAPQQPQQDPMAQFNALAQIMPRPEQQAPAQNFLMRGAAQQTPFEV